MLISFQVLLQVGGDVDAAVEFLVAEQAAEIYSGINNDADTSHGNGLSVMRFTM